MDKEPYSLNKRWVLGTVSFFAKASAVAPALRPKGWSSKLEERTVLQVEDWDFGICERVGSGVDRSGGSGVFMLNVVRSPSGTIVLSVKKPRLVA